MDNFITLKVAQDLAITSATIAVKKALSDLGISKSEISKAEAYRRFGRRTIDRWINQKKITLLPRGKSFKINIIELESYSSSIALHKEHFSSIT